MKYLLVLSLVGLVFFLWQTKRRADLSQRPPAPAARRTSQVQTTDMVACAVCQLHLPRTEALMTPGASYCCEAHRVQAESSSASR